MIDAEAASSFTYAAGERWKINDGLYLGAEAKSPLGVEGFPLDRQDELAAVGPEHPVKSRWQLTGSKLRYTGDAHGHTIAPNGSGKSRKVILPNLYGLQDWSIVLFDPKGEHCAQTLLPRKAAGSECIVFDPLGVIPATYPKLYAKHADVFKSRGINVLAGLKRGSDSFNDNLKDITAAMRKVDQNRESYWSDAARGLNKGLLWSLIADQGDEAATLNDLRATLAETPENLAKLIAEYIKDYGGDDLGLKASLSEFVAQTAQDRELSGIRRTAKTDTEWLDSPLIQKELRGKGFDFKSIKTKPTTIYIVIPPTKIADYAVWLRLMLTVILNPLLESTEDWTVPTLFMLDEIAQLGKVEIIQRYFPVLRQYGVKLWMFWQDINQMKIYGDTWGSFISNMGFVQAFSSNDPDTKEYLSKMRDTRQRRHKTESKSESVARGENQGWNSGGGMSLASMTNGNSGGTSTNFTTSWNQNEQIIEERVIKPREIGALDRDETIVFWRKNGITLTVCPQPQLLRDIYPALEAARAEIEGRAAPALTATPTGTATPAQEIVDA